MRNNIIAVLIFIGFIATVFGVGYAVSRDNMPMRRGGLPSISTSGSRSVSRTADNGLTLQQVASEPINRSSGGYAVTPSYSQQSANSGDGGSSLHSGSSQRVNSYGGSSAIGANNSMGVSHTSGGTSNKGGISAGGGTGSFYAIRSDRRLPSLAVAPQADEPMVIEDKDYTLQTVNENPPDPFMNPVGDVPTIPIGLLCILFVFLDSKRKSKQSE